MKQLFQMIDIYGNKFNFKLNGNDNFKTFSGGILTVITIVFVIIFAFFFGQDFYYGKNPIIYTTTKVPEKYDDPIPITPKNFVFAWRIEDYDKRFLDFKGYIYALSSWAIFTKDADGSLSMKEKIFFNDVKCNPENAQVEEFTKSHILNDWYCYDFSKGNFTFGGFWDGDYVVILQTALFLCKDGKTYSKDSPDCVNLENYKEFETKNRALQISILYPQFYFEADDLQQPLKMTYKNYYYYFNLKTSKIDRFFFSIIKLRDDRGWIFEDVKESSILSYNRNQGDQNINEIVEGGSSAFYELNLYMEKSSQIINRSYMKIQDLSAKVGGMIKFVMTVLSFLNYYYNNHHFKTYLFKNLFTFNQEDLDAFIIKKPNQSRY